MPKITVMKYNQLVMATLGINPHSFESQTLNWLQSMSPFLMTITLSMCVLLATLYAYQETRLPLILEAIVLVIGGITALLAYLNMKWKVDSVGEVNSKLQEIVDQGNLKSNF